MISIYFSHTGEISELGGTSSEEVQPGTLREILNNLECMHPGICQYILDESGVGLNSSVLIFKKIVIENGRILEGEGTTPVYSLQEQIQQKDENLLIAIFHPEKILAFLLETLTNTDARFRFASSSREFRSYISSPKESLINQTLFVETTPEALYPFTTGRPISELATTELLNAAQSRMLPAALQKAIARLWEIDIDIDFRLRLFQEEALIHIVSQLAQSKNSVPQPLLLSIPTGGGKTEAFLIPLIAHLYDQRERQLRSNIIPDAKVRSIVIYPTRALANDQARRMAEILYELNAEALEDRKISVGVLTGDTPNSNYNLLTEKSLLQLCPRCSAVLTNFPEKQVQGSSQPLIIARCTCGAEIDYFRLTRFDILNHPPDILITSPDMINRMLQSPRYHHKIFTSSIDLVVFDEIHLYDSIFGCNVAHLLRRFEEACEKKPLYVGVSATIHNAKELACLIFDADSVDVKYLHAKLRGEEETEEKRPYLDYQAPPTRYRYHYAVAPARKENGKEQKVITAVLNVADAIGHLIRDPHFRKTLIFSNFRQDTDDIVRYLRDQEDRYYSVYNQSLFPRLLSAKNISEPTPGQGSFTKTEEDIILAIDRWYRRAREIGSLHEANLEIGWHRGGLERDERIKAVNRFSASKRLTGTGEENYTELPIDIMVATSTLEVGIDIGDVTTVINSSAPFTTNEYTQRVGRGGRRKDSLALTIVDPHNPLDFYFLKNFERYAHPTADDFEDAPIIISNESVFKSHVYARLLDKLAAQLYDSNLEEIKAVHLRTAVSPSVNSQKTFQDDWKSVSEALFSAAFPLSRIQQLQSWMKREAQLIPEICESEINEQQLRAWWREKCEQLHRHLCSSDRKIQDTDDLSGMGSKDRELVPDLRSSGPSVGLYIIREGTEDELSDTLSRKQAIASRPIGGYASQGSVTFKIEAIKEEDYDAETRIKQQLRSPEGAKAILYFHQMFGDADNLSPFPSDIIDVLMNVQLKTPKDLSVKYNPYRFYCSRCGATYSNKPAGDKFCRYCHAELRQLTEIYTCGGCGEIYTPPIPKVCLNPSCIEQAKSKKDGKSFVPLGYKQVGKFDQHNDYFRFRALPMLTWQCKSCGTEVNYHAYYQLDPNILKQLENAKFGMDSAQMMAKTFLFRPESWFGKSYIQDGFQSARFNCKKCKDAGKKYTKIHVKNIPSFRSVVHEYVIKKHQIAPELTWDQGVLDFQQVNVIALAREYFRRFYSYAENDVQINLQPIFPNSNSYLANTYNTHAVFFHFNEQLDEFLLKDQTALACAKGTNCQCKARISSPVPKSNDSGSDSTLPMPALLSWEKGRKPDPRRKWCRVVQKLEPHKTCPGQEMLCTDCPYFDAKQHQRYLILHTLEHAITITMPKYTGINKNQVRGLIYPNDEQEEYDLVLLDATEGGSGSFYLLRKNWSLIWRMVGELLEAAQSEEDQLILPYTCARYNRDLCPHLAFAFYRYVQQQRD